MADQPQVLDEGFDPTTDPTCISAAELLQMVRSASFTTNMGGVISSQTAPDHTTYPGLKTYLWRKLNGSNEATGEFYYYDDAAGSWELLVQFDGSDIVNGSITYDKLATSTAYYILQMNGAGTAWVGISIPNAIQAASIVLAKLDPTGLGTWLNNNLAAGDLDVTLITPGTAGYIVRTNAAGTEVEFADILDCIEDYSIGIDKISYDTTTLTYSGTTITVNAALNASFYLQLTANVTSFSINNLRNGQAITVALQQDGVGGRTVTFDSSIKWPANTPPTVTATISKADVITFVKINNTIYGSAVQNFTI